MKQVLFSLCFVLMLLAFVHPASAGTSTQDSLTVRQTTVTDDVGDPRDYDHEPGNTDTPPKHARHRHKPPKPQLHVTQNPPATAPVSNSSSPARGLGSHAPCPEGQIWNDSRHACVPKLNTQH